jgi:hypothetical protein
MWGMEAQLQLYPRRQNSQYPSDRRLGGPQGRSDRYGREKSFAIARNRDPVVQPVAKSLCRLIYPDSHLSQGTKNKSHESFFRLTGL